MSDEFGEAVRAAYDRMPQWRKDQFEASVRDICALVKKVADFMERWEACGIEAAEDYANGDRP